MAKKDLSAKDCFRLQQAVKRVFVRNWLVVDKVRIHVSRSGSIQISGFLDRFPAKKLAMGELRPRDMNSLYQDLRRELRGGATLVFTLDNWSFKGDKWTKM